MLAGNPQYRVLGPLQVVVDGREVTISAAKQRTLLATLLLRANTTVTTDELVERLWENDPPAGARDTVRAYVMRLRNLIGGRDTIVTMPSGYLIQVEPCQLDLLHVHELIAEPHGLHEAWSLWRGPALQDVPSDSLRRDELPVLEELRLHVLTRRIEEDLALGRHAEVVAELHRSVAEHPLHEGLVGQLMLALYRSGRPAEALENYQRLRARLADELGTDPGADLRELHRRVLTGDPALMLAPTSAVSVPRQLPAMPRWFTGRTQELAELDQGGAVVISAIGGAGGIGKTWLALHWAHRSLSRFPDGQLYVNLRGFDPLGTPLDPAVAVRGFLDALGVQPGAVPTDLESQVGMYRSLVAERRMLLVLDNARDTAQVEPLLPGGAACTTLVTSRHQLAGLVVNHGATLLTLDVLDDAEARRLLASRLGEDRVASELDAIRELVGRCAGLPLALGIVAARAAMQPGTPLADLAEQLRQESLDAFDAGELTANLRAVFTCSHRALSAEAAEAFRLLGLAPGPDISLQAAANLTGFGIEELNELEDAHLVQQHVPGRYRMHDLVRLFAAEQAAAYDDGKPLRRLADFYLQTADHADRLIYPQRPRIDLIAPDSGITAHKLDDSTEAMAWLETEHACLLAAQNRALEIGLHEHVWQFAWALSTYNYRRGHVAGNWLMWDKALVAADRLGDYGAQTLAHRYVGRALARLGDVPGSLHHLKLGVEAADRTGDPFKQGQAHYSYAAGVGQHGDFTEAVVHASLARDRFRTARDIIWEAKALNSLGWHQAQCGDLDDARRSCVLSMRLAWQAEDIEGQCEVLDSLGYIEHAAGDHAAAIDYYRQGLKLLHVVGNVFEEPGVLERLGVSLHALGAHGDALDNWHHAYALYQSQNRTEDAERTRRLMDSAGGGRR